MTELDLLGLLKVWGPSGATAAVFLYVVVAVCRRMEMQCRTCAAAHNRVLAMLGRSTGFRPPTPEDDRGGPIGLSLNAGPDRPGGDAPRPLLG